MIYHCTLYKCTCYVMIGGVTCDSGWTLSASTGRCYKMMTSRISWAEARAHCQGLGTNGDLASIPDQETNEIIMSLLSTVQRRYWIGGTDAASEGAWQWADGTPWGYTNWRRGQPDNDMGGQHHLYISGPSEGEVHGQWTDTKGETNNLMFICQY